MEISASPTVPKTGSESQGAEGSVEECRDALPEPSDDSLEPSLYFVVGMQRIDRIARDHRSTVEDLIGQKRADRFFDCALNLWYLLDEDAGRLRWMTRMCSGGCEPGKRFRASRESSTTAWSVLRLGEGIDASSKSES